MPDVRRRDVAEDGNVDIEDEDVRLRPSAGVTSHTKESDRQGHNLPPTFQSSHSSIPQSGGAAHGEPAHSGSVSAESSGCVPASSNRSVYTTVSPSAAIRRLKPLPHLPPKDSKPEPLDVNPTLTSLHPPRGKGLRGFRLLPPVRVAPAPCPSSSFLQMSSMVSSPATVSSTMERTPSQLDDFLYATGLNPRRTGTPDSVWEGRKPENVEPGVGSCPGDQRCVGCETSVGSREEGFG